MKKILFVEDESFLQKLLSSLLEEAGYKVFSASDGEIGLSILEKEKPDLVLLDLILPKKDGFEFLEIMRGKEETRNTPVVVLTNLEEKYNLEKAMSYGIRAYLIKANYKPEGVVEKIKEILA